MTQVLEGLRQIADLGGPVVMILLAVSVVTLATILYKLWQFFAVGVGRHRALKEAVNAWDRGDRSAALRALKQSRSYLAPVVEMAFAAEPQDAKRLEAGPRCASPGWKADFACWTAWHSLPRFWGFSARFWG
jgi:biopolymer transport protein ExbB